MIKKILTRRNFLSDSAKHSFGSIFLPSLATLLRNERAIAAGDACHIDGQQMPAFIAIDLQGGGSIAGTNVMVYDKGGELLTDYTGLGLQDPPTAEDIDTTFGLPMHKGSPMLRGMKATTTAEVQAKVNGFVICAQSADDTSSNRMATAPGIFKAGCSGSIVPLVGMRAGSSGGNSMTPFGAGVSPTVIEDLNSAQQLISAGELWQGTRAARLEKVLKTVESLSETRMQAFGNLSLSQQAAEMVKCGYVQAQQMMGGSDKPDLNPDNDPQLTKQTATTKRGWHHKRASSEAVKQISYMVLKGYAGSGTITLPGFDYHDSNVGTAFNADIQAGQVIGSALQMAADLNRKLMLHIYTDGGVDSARGAADGGANDESANNGEEEGAPEPVNRKAFTGDAETRAAAFVLVYDPAGRPELTAQQMGAYQSADNGTVDVQPGKHNIISNNPEAHATAVIANYLAWQGREAELFTKVNSSSPLRETELRQYLLLGGV